MKPRLPYRLPAPTVRPQEVLIVLMVLLLGASATVTHWLAWRLGHHHLLGPPVWDARPLGMLALMVAAILALTAVALAFHHPRKPQAVVGLALALPLAVALALGPIYVPTAWVVWRQRLSSASTRSPEAAHILDDINQALFIAAGAVILGLIAQAVAAGPTRGDTHGSARFATSREIARLGLRKGKTGIVIGGERRLGRQIYYTAPDRRHVGIFGPSGCGKTTKLIVPTLLMDESSMVVLDIKMELWQLTAGYRRHGMGHEVHAFAPSIQAPWVSGYNPILDIPRGPEDVAYAQAIAQALVDPEGKMTTPDFWHASAESLLTAAVLHIFHTRAERGLAGVQELLAAPGKGIRSQLELLTETDHDPTLEQGWTHPATGEETATHPAILLETGKLLDLAKETLTGIVATARSRLAVFLDPIIADNTRMHSFSLRDLGDPAKPITIYLILPARDLGRLAGLLRLFLQMLSFHLTGALAGNEGQEEAQHSAGLPQRRLTLILDELAAVGRLDLIARQIAYLRGYGIQVVAAVQTVSQLYEIYGRNESFRGNVAYLVVFPSTEQRTAEEISRLLGDQTLLVESRSRSTGSTWLSSRRSTGTRDQKRPLLTPDEVRRLPPESPVLLATGEFPVLNRLVGFFGSRVLTRRATAKAGQRGA